MLISKYPWSILEQYEADPSKLDLVLAELQMIKEFLEVERTGNSSSRFGESFSKGYTRYRDMILGAVIDRIEVLSGLIPK